MAKIRKTNIYPYDSNVTLDDYVIGTDNEDSKKTKSYRIGDIAGLITEIIGMVSGNFLIQGGAVWLEDLDYEVTPLVYYIGGTFYTASGAVVTLEEADATHPRIDVIYVDTDGVIGVIEGDPSANPVKPQVDGVTQLEVTFVLIEANATEPSGVSDVIIYDENLGSNDEWDVEPYGFVDGEVELDSELDPYNGIYHIYVKGLIVGNKGLNFIQGDSLPLITVSSYQSLSFHIKLRAPQTTDARFLLKFINSTDDVEAVGQGVVLLTTLNLDLNNNAGYQLVIIPFSILNFVGNQFDTIQLEFQQIDTVYIDRIRLIGGVVNPPTLNSYLALTDTDDTYIEKAGYTPIVRANETGLDLTRTKLLIDGYWVDNHGVYSETIKVGDTIEGYTSSEKTKYIIAKVNALPITDLDNLTLILNTDL